MDNRRKNIRFPFDEPIGYQRYENAPLEGSVGEDISLSGLKIRVNSFIPLNTVLDLHIHFPSQVQVTPARAKVVWVKEMPFRDDSWEMGLELVLSESSRTAFRNYVGIDQPDIV